jgi:hypothetical protein
VALLQPFRQDRSSANTFLALARARTLRPCGLRSPLIDHVFGGLANGHGLLGHQLSKGTAAERSYDTPTTFVALYSRYES